MSRPITYSPLPDPGGLTPKEWAREVRLLKAKGWLQDPEVISWSEDPEHEKNVARRRQEGACLRCCWRGNCLKAGRCLHLIHLAIRENRHNIWPDTWRERLARGDLNESRPFVPADQIPRLAPLPSGGRKDRKRKKR